MPDDHSAPNHMNSMLDKLVLAGWIEGVAQKDRPQGGMEMGVKFTSLGRMNLGMIYSLVRQIESAAGSEITHDEMPYLKAIAQLSAFRPPEQRGKTDRLS